MDKEDVVVGGFYKAVKGNHCEINGYHCFKPEDKLQWTGKTNIYKGAILGDFLQSNGTRQLIYYADIEAWAEE